MDLYIEYCLHQNEATRQLEAKLASDVRFRQLVNESQRKLKKILEQQEEASGRSSSSASGLAQGDDLGQRSRAIRNSNLPLTSFLLKPIQRITKYSLIFDRMLKVINEEGPRHLLSQVGRLKVLSQDLCSQINEACRVKEDDEDNKRKLRWCQSHIKQSSNQFDPSDPLAKQSISSDLKLVSSLSDTSTSQPTCLPETIRFSSLTKHLGPRRLISAACFIKLRSTQRELVLFLFNDVLLVTQVKGGVCLRVDDIFKSERAQQAYFKHYRPPVLLEDLSMVTLDDLHNQSVSFACQPIYSDEQEALIINFLDGHTGNAFYLKALNLKQKNDWSLELTQRSLEAKKARGAFESQTNLRLAKRLSIDECYGRLFFTVLELIQAPTNLRNSSSPQLNDLSSWDRSRSAEMSLQTVRIQIQLRRYKRIQTAFDQEKREVIPSSDMFKTEAVIFDSNSSVWTQRSCLDPETSPGLNGVGSRSVYSFENDSTQFLIERRLNDDGVDYLDVELVEDSRFQATRLVARKRLNIGQLLGFDTEEPKSLSRQSTRSSRVPQVVQPNRPIEMILKLKSVPNNNQQNFIPRNSQEGRSSFRDDSNIKFSVKLKLHFQLFCDN